MRSKRLKLFSVNPEAWTSSQELPEAKRVELCRNACVKKQEECRAYFFDETSKICEIGDDFGGSPDPIKLPTDQGTHVYAEKSFSPEIYPHLALFGGARQLELDFSFKSNTSVSPWHSPWTTTTGEWHAVGMYYDDGFFLCASASATNTVCQHQKLGTETWQSLPAMPVPVIYI